MLRNARKGIALTNHDIILPIRHSNALSTRQLRTSFTNDPIQPPSRYPLHTQHRRNHDSFKFSQRHFHTSVIRSQQEHDIDASSQSNGDGVIGLLNLLQQKRDLLIQQEELNKGDTELLKSIGELDPINRFSKEWQDFQKIASNLLSMTDPSIEPDEDLREMAIVEAQSTLQQIEELRQKIRKEILPRDPLDNQSAIMEIRPGVGGQESCIFTAELARMYTRFCSEIELINDDGSQTSLQVEQLSVTPADATGSSGGSGTDAYKEIILSIKGFGAYGLLRHEAGVHRVQRVPTTININKLQSSTIAIVVLPSAEDDKSSSKSIHDDLVDPKDVKEEVMRSRGAGGQHVNKTESAIRLTHEPTGITVSMQDSRSQHQNRVKAWDILRARLLDRKMREEQSQVRDVRRSQIASMSRMDRIRTFNYPQDRVTDHRVPISTNGLGAIMEGDAKDGGLLYLIDSLKDHHDNLVVDGMQKDIKQDIQEIKQKLATAKKSNLN